MNNKNAQSITILHLSDIHRTPDEPVTNDSILHPLIADLKLQQSDENLPKPDLLVISGDLTQSGHEEEYKEAFTLINTLKDELTDPVLNRVIVVPGNHDINWDICEEKICSGSRKPSQVDDTLLNTNGKHFWWWKDEKTFGHRFALFSQFYRSIYERDYSIERRKQYDIWFYPELRICFVGFNSCDQVDHMHFHGGIYEEAFFEAEKSLKEKGLTESPREYLKIAVWHHDLNWLGYTDRVDCLDPSILGHLVNGGYDLALCGHTHRTDYNLYDYSGYSLPVVASGSLCAGRRQRGESIPRLYNLICIEGNRARVHTRFRDTKDVPWRPYARWGKRPCSYFDVLLSKTLSARPIIIKNEVKPDPVPPADFTFYLNYLKQETKYIDVRGLVTGKGRVHQFPIDELYIPLKTHYGTKAGKRMFEEDVLLQKALKEPRLFIKGDPGSGKTTFLRLIAYTFCQKKTGEESKSPLVFPESSRLPLFIRLGTLSRYMSQCKNLPSFSCPSEAASPAWLVYYLEHQSRDFKWKLTKDDFDRELEEGRCMILLDGLDEAPSQEVREHLSAFASNLIKTYPKCPVVLTSRPAALTSGEIVPMEFHTIEIEALDVRGIEDFLNRWCSVLYADAPKEGQRYKMELREALNCHSHIRAMAKTPVMLTALAVLHWNEHSLPEQRAVLYESVLTWLFRSRSQREGRLKADRCRQLLQKLALAMFTHSEGRQRETGLHWAAQILASEFTDSKELTAMKIGENFLRDEMVDSGIIVERNHRLEFWHLSFQEYLAAYEIGGLSDKKQLDILFQKERLYSSEWRELILLLAGVLYKQGKERINHLIDAIIDKEPKDTKKETLPLLAKKVGLLGGIVRDLSPFDFQPANPLYSDIVRSVMGIFDKETFRKIPVQLRIEVADTLGRVGDPRFDKEKNLWVLIPAGHFWMGAQYSDRQKRNYDKDAYEDEYIKEFPVHEVELSAFWIGRYPVTVGNYMQFIEDGGYKDERFWHNGGFGECKEPGEWEDQLQYPTRPVVHISWYEASAYAAWAGCRLPTESEWERAARGPEQNYRKYPWGNKEPDKETCNFYESGIGSCTPVGIFPENCSPEGAMDMAGNVWEWCSDWYGKYPSPSITNPEGPTSGSYRVVRGGSLIHEARVCRSAYRNGETPSHRNRILGFRLVKDVLVKNSNE